MNRKALTISMAVIALWLSGCEAKIQQNLDEKQANEIVTALLERGFQPKKELEAGKKPTWSIVVDSDHADDATRVLVELGLPREKQPTGADLLKPGIVPSPTEEFELKVLGLQGDISRTLESVDGVIAARVHLVLSPPPRAGQPQIASKAAAFIRVRAGKAAWMEQHKDDLRALIAGSVEGLSADSVTLVVNEVAPTVAPVVQNRGVETRLRYTVMFLGALVSALAAAMVYLVLRQREVTPTPVPAMPAKATSASVPAKKAA